MSLLSRYIVLFLKSLLHGYPLAALEVVVMVDWEVMMLVIWVGGRALEGKDL